jgi:hypothetical protein
MKATPTKIADVFLLEAKVFGDGCQKLNLDLLPGEMVLEVFECNRY